MDVNQSSGNSHEGIDEPCCEITMYVFQAVRYSDQHVKSEVALEGVKVDALLVLIFELFYSLITKLIIY